MISESGARPGIHRRCVQVIELISCIFHRPQAKLDGGGFGFQMLRDVSKYHKAFRNNGTLPSPLGLMQFPQSSSSPPTNFLPMDAHHQPPLGTCSSLYSPPHSSTPMQPLPTFTLCSVPFHPMFCPLPCIFRVNPDISSPNICLLHGSCNGRGCLTPLLHHFDNIFGWGIPYGRRTSWPQQSLW